uniref:Uncharacterized protein n=1 Tax=Anguilla anguilla TaxID=7936 RepID=A0A0E9UN71_ANGAN
MTQTGMHPVKGSIVECFSWTDLEATLSSPTDFTNSAAWFYHCTVKLGVPLRWKQTSK